MRRPASSLVLALGLAAAASTGCAQLQSHSILPTAESCNVKGAPRPQVPAGTLLAQTIKVDITPPPGLSMYGYGLEGHIATGLFTHLFCRGFYFRNAEQPLVWLSCDLQGMSEPVHRRVAEMVQAQVADLGADRIVLSATHTHGGPGHFHEGRALQSALGGSRWPAYDQRVVDFFALRIAGAVLRAAQAPGIPVTLSSHVAPCRRGLSKNRALVAYALNTESNDDGCARQDKQDNHFLDPIHRAVGRTLTAVRVNSAYPGQPALGLMAVYALHNTAVAPDNELYSADVFGLADNLCETVLGRDNPGFLCAIANGAEGDVSPDVAEHGEAEARRIGERLGLEMVDAFKEAKSADPLVMESRYREMLFPGAPVSALSTADGKSGRLCPYPNINAPSGGGAPDGPTRLRIFEQINPGMTFPPPPADACAPARIELLGIVPTNVADYKNGWGFPTSGPMMWMRLGNQRFLTLPGEPTTTTASQLQKVADQAAPPAEAGGKKVEHTTIVGLTDAYFLYFATEREFAAQQYEGASTLYGPKSAAFLADSARALLASPRAPAPDCKDPQDAVTPLAASFQSQWPEKLGVSPDMLAPAPAPAPAHPGSDGQTHVVGVATMAPSPNFSRWPDGLDVRRACASRVGPVDTAPDPAFHAELACEQSLPVVRVTWKEPAGPKRALCTESDADPLATLLVEATRGGPLQQAFAHLQLDPAITKPENAWTTLAPTLALEGAGPPVDDRHALVDVSYDYDKGTWAATYRFAAPTKKSYAPGSWPAFAMRVMTADGRVHTSTLTAPLGTLPPDCLGRATTHWQRKP